MALWERRSLVVARQCQHQRFQSCRPDCVPADGVPTPTAAANKTLVQVPA